MRVSHEKNVSAIEQETGQRPRISPADEDQAGPGSPETATGQGPQTPHRSDRQQVVVSSSNARIRGCGQRWPRCCRLTQDDDFRQVLRHGHSFAAGWFRLLFWPDPLGRSRFAISVRRSVGNACARNLARRQLRESLRLAQSRWPQHGWGLVIINQPTPGQLSGAERQAIVERFLDRACRMTERCDL